MTFHIYENWHRDRGRVHRSDCSYCNDGKGHQASDSGDNGRWLGPFHDRAVAFRVAEALGRAEMQSCKKCGP
jgi:hypothetical protein